MHCIHHKMLMYGVIGSLQIDAQVVEKPAIETAVLEHSNRLVFYQDVRNHFADHWSEFETMTRTGRNH